MVEPNAKFWEEIYLRNIGKMIGICSRYTSNRQLAEDLAHDAFLKAIDKAGSFKGEGVFEAWLRRVVVNHVLTYIRDQKRHQRIDDWLHNENNVAHTDVDNAIADQSESCEFSTRELLDVINGLPEHHRVVFNLYVIDDFKHAQIAEALGISEGTSKSHLARARKKIRQLLAEKEKSRRQAILLFLLPHRIDRLFGRQFNDFRVVHHKSLPDFSNAPTLSMSLPSASTFWMAIAASVLGSMIVISVIIHQTRQDDQIYQVHDKVEQSVFKDSTKLTPGDEVKRVKTLTGKKNNSHRADSNAATFRASGVIQSKITKTNRMKTLDSLGLGLIMSAALVIDSAAQSTVKVNAPASSETKTVEPGEQVTNIVQFSAPKTKKSRKQKGTFYATSLHWSAENHELYFKGKVKVDVGENHFVSDGSVTFLDKVYMLIIDGSSVKLDSTVKLSRQQYHLTQLSNKEAMEKYGEEGANGAVEINVIEE